MRYIHFYFISSVCALTMKEAVSKWRMLKRWPTAVSSTPNLLAHHASAKDTCHGEETDPQPSQF